jgi:SAM-dependent methyltransferase
VNVSLLSTGSTLERESPLGTVGLWLLDQVRLEAWDRVLFVECGDGWLVEEAWRRMRRGRVHGLSTSPRLVDLAVQLRGVPGWVEFSTWGGEGFPLPDRSFDRVISCASLGSYREPSALLHEVGRVLRPGGDAYLFDGDPTPLTMPKALAAACLVEVQRNRCESVLTGPGAHPMPIVIRARPS